MPASSKKEFSPLQEEFAQALAFKISDFITSAALAAPGRIASPNTMKLVARRVRPSELSNYDVLDQYASVIWDETMTILDRIIVYPFIVEYRTHLRGAPRGVLKAWQFHSHSLRVGELYIVQDRTAALLEFLKSVTADFGLPTTDCRKEFESGFKKTFKRRLLERHRLTHAHERPSLTSRVIDFAGAKQMDDKGELPKGFDELFDRMMSILIRANKNAGGEPIRELKDIEALHKLHAEQEAWQMFKIVGESLLRTINDPELSSE